MSERQDGDEPDDELVGARLDEDEGAGERRQPEQRAAQRLEPTCRARGRDARRRVLRSGERHQ